MAFNEDMSNPFWGDLSNNHVSPKLKDKVYFCGSIRAGRADADLYARIIKKLEVNHSCDVLTAFVGDPELTEMGSEVEGGTDKDIHDRDINWLMDAKLVVAEVTQPSLGVGYELGWAFNLNKRILCLYRPQEGKKLSAMIRGMPERLATVVDYKEEDLDDILEKFFKGFRLKPVQTYTPCQAQ